MPKDYESTLPKVLDISNREIEIASDEKGIPSVTITKFSKEQSTGEIKIGFYAFESGYRYKGEIIFKCVDDNLIFEDIHYLSEID